MPAPGGSPGSPRTPVSGRLPDVDLLRPVDESLVQLRAGALEEPVVRSVLTSRCWKRKVVPSVSETGFGWTSCFRARPCRWSGTSGRTSSGVSYLEGRLCKLLADDTRGLDDGPLSAIEQIQAGGDQGLDAGRYIEAGEVAQPVPIGRRPGATIRRRSASRAAVRRRAGCPRPPARCGPARRWRCPFRPGVLHHEAAVGIGQWLEHQPQAVLAERPVRMELEQIVPAGTQHEHRRALDRLHEVTDELQEGRLRPMDVVHHQQHRAVVRQALQESARPQNTSGTGYGVSDRPMADAIRSATSASGIARQACEGRPPAGRRSPMPAASRAASRSGQKVMPSPYGRHRPRMTVACSAWAAVNSRISRALAHAGVADHRRHPADAFD